MTINKKISCFHFITHPVEGGSPYHQVQQALKGGCDWFQLRMKKHHPDAIMAEAVKIIELKKEAGFTMIINDHPDIALRTGADGVHLGKLDLSPTEARRILGDQFIIGGTANTIEDIDRLVDQGVDYIGLGPFRFTSTKENLSTVLGLEGYRNIFPRLISRNIRVPVIGIGGILLDDIPALLETGMHGIAAASSIIKSASIEETTCAWMRAVREYKNQTNEFLNKKLISNN